MADEVRVPITSDADLVTARAEARAMAERLGFPRPDPTLIATAISEIARNIVVHVGRGEIVLEPFEDADRYGVVVIARDEGPGIRDVEAALRDDYSGRGGLGLGLPGARRLMDDFEVSSDPDTGTTVTMCEVALPRRARAAARGAPAPCLSRPCESRSSGAWRRGAGPARRRAATSRSSRSCRRARSSRRSTGSDTVPRRRTRPARPPTVLRESPSAGPRPASSSAATSR